MAQSLQRPQYSTANKVICEHKIITLTSKESVRFVSILINPPAPNAALKKATKRYNAFQNKKNLPMKMVEKI